jgi:HMG (high mobility group) box
MSLANPPQFISGLSNLESGVHELRRAYISHFNTLLPENHPGRLSLPFFTSFDNSTGAGLGGRNDSPAAEANQKKKRKPHDPNAPKRALTSYFLFMQHNKPQIKEQHPDWDAKQVAEESERRWNNISEAEKQVCRRRLLATTRH